MERTIGVRVVPENWSRLGVRFAAIKKNTEREEHRRRGGMSSPLVGTNRGRKGSVGGGKTATWVTEKRRVSK